MNKTEWMQMKNVWVSKEPVLPGVWQRKEGGHVVRGRATDGKTGKQKDIFRALPEADAPMALKWLRDEQTRIRAGADDSPEKPRQRFAEFAASLFEHKVKVRDIKSAACRAVSEGGRRYTLTHLIAGTTGAEHRGTTSRASAICSSTRSRPATSSAGRGSWPSWSRPGTTRPRR